ncbi:ABC transporter permease [Desulfosarcina cetonica]|uniref:ABC transporter permease n=1 Tax=Desulfosarcina cetonica TaxID=90730 RepID=UPI000A6FAE6C|nr:ABC transporter permease [Desulfosarcina cetonica]
MNPFWQRFKASYLLYSFRQDRTAIFSFVVLLALLVTGLLAPLIAPHDPYDPASIDIMNAELPPAWMAEDGSGFFLGTDNQGRDLLSTMIYGLRLSILIGCGAVMLQGAIGVIVGLLAGYLGGKIDAVLMRIADIQLSFPYLMVAIFISAIFQVAFGIGRYEALAVPLLVVIIGLAEWPVYARTVRASVMGEKNKEYVEAARVIGLSRWRIMFRHVLPNTMTSVLVISTIQVANAS